MMSNCLASFLTHRDNSHQVCQRKLPNGLFSKPRSNPDLMKTKRRFLRCFSFPGVWRQLLPADDQVHPLEGDPGPLPGEGGDLHAGQVRGHLRQVLQHVSRSKSDSRYCMADDILT